MEHLLWKAIVDVLSTLDQPAKPTAFDYSDADIVKVYYWSVICDRPLSWACRRAHWPIPLRKRKLPSPATLSRRLRSSSVATLLTALERRVIAPRGSSLFWMIDGKPLTIGGCSKDRQAGYGRAAGGKAKGYQLHALVAADGQVAGWRIAPMNRDERVMAERLLKAAPADVVGYVAADTNYDSNRLHEICEMRSNLQLVTLRRYGASAGLGHRSQTVGRLRSMALTEGPVFGLGLQLLQDRSDIERQFGNLTNWSCGLSNLPAWVRTHRRVAAWVQAKLTLTQLKRDLKLRTCAV
jgi:hypothetical protein